MKALLKRKLLDFLDWHVLSRMEALAAEGVYQQIFAEQCRNSGIVNEFYPVGAAANYGLMYLLHRILTENDVRTLIELGSGQSSLLIDRLRTPQLTHVCYEEDEAWYESMKARLGHCEYTLSPLVERTIDGIPCMTYRDLKSVPFDVLLVDGPRGVDRYSRFGCIELIRNNTREDFVIVFDDCGRAGERDTIAHAESVLCGQGRDFKGNTLVARNSQYVITAGKYRAVSYYY